MSREIKFRAWDKELQTMISPELFADLLNGKEVAYSENRTTKVPAKVTEVQGLDIGSGARPLIRHVDEWEDKTETVRVKTYKGNPFSLNNIELMQYTGLKDKNGAEIYEGDILRWLPEWYETADAVNVVVRWVEQVAGFNSEATDKEIIEVIGNIYDNPELLP